MGRHRAGPACGGPPPSPLLLPFWLHCPSLRFFLPLLSIGLAICHLPPRPPTTLATAVPSVRLSHQPRLPWLLLPASSCPIFSNGGCRSFRLLPGGPPHAPARACSLRGWRALALPGRSDPLGHLLFSLETKISWACPKLFQVCLPFFFFFPKNIQIPRGKSAPLTPPGLLLCESGGERGREIAGAFGKPSRSVSWVLALRVSRWGLGRQPRPLCPLPLASLLGPHLEPPQERSCL